MPDVTLHADDFAGMALSDAITTSTPETGSAWEADAGTFVSDGNGGVYNTTTTTVALAPEQPASDANIRFRARIKIESTGVNNFPGPYFEYVDAGNKGYQVRADIGGNEVEFVRWGTVSGATNSVVSLGAKTWVVGAEYDLDIQIQDNGTTKAITGFLDGVQIGSTQNLTDDNRHTSIPKGGIRTGTAIAGASTGGHFTSTELVETSGALTPPGSISGATAYVRNENKQVIEWSAPASDAESHEVDVSFNGGAYSNVGSTGAASTSLEHGDGTSTVFAPGTYTYRVRGYNSYLGGTYGTGDTVDVVRIANPFSVTRASLTGDYLYTETDLGANASYWFNTYGGTEVADALGGAGRRLVLKSSDHHSSTGIINGGYCTHPDGTGFVSLGTLWTAASMPGGAARFDQTETPRFKYIADDPEDKPFHIEFSAQDNDTVVPGAVGVPQLTYTIRADRLINPGTGLFDPADWELIDEDGTLPPVAGYPTNLVSVDYSVHTGYKSADLPFGDGTYRAFSLVQGGTDSRIGVWSTSDRITYTFVEEVDTDWLPDDFTKEVSMSTVEFVRLSSQWYMLTAAREGVGGGDYDGTLIALPMNATLTGPTGPHYDLLTFNIGFESEDFRDAKSAIVGTTMYLYANLRRDTDHANEPAPSNDYDDVHAYTISGVDATGESVVGGASEATVSTFGAVIQIGI